MSMRRTRWLACASLLIAAATSAQPAATPTLEGLWAAYARYGPDVRGTLMILKRGDGLVADIAGYSAPVKQDGDTLRFELPEGVNHMPVRRDRRPIGRRGRPAGIRHRGR